jgi:hypothetical protein
MASAHDGGRLGNGLQTERRTSLVCMMESGFAVCMGDFQPLNYWGFAGFAQEIRPVISVFCQGHNPGLKYFY